MLVCVQAASLFCGKKCYNYMQKINGSYGQWKWGRGDGMADTTNALLKRIVGSKDFREVLEENGDAFEERSISEYLRKLCEERGMVSEQVIKKAQIDRTYGHQIFNGTRLPSRDKLLMLSFGFELSLDETQELLKTAGKSILYPKVKRDAAIIYGISHKMNIMDVQYLLTSVHLPLLGEA